MQQQELPELLTIKEVASILKVTTWTLRQWDKKGILVAIRIGARKDRRYKRQDIITFLEQK